jgi:hypothetical protein
LEEEYRAIPREYENSTVLLPTYNRFDVVDVVSVVFAKEGLEINYAAVLIAYKDARIEGHPCLLEFDIEESPIDRIRCHGTIDTGGYTSPVRG